MGIETYRQHAAVWDWDGYDNSEEYEYWCRYAARFGRNILIPMCALGEAGAFMAQSGFTVTAFDITEEMIAQGKKRFRDLPGLHLVTGDICSFSSPRAPFDFIFLKDQDLHLLPSLKTAERALRALYAQLRPGGALVLELTLPDGESRREEKRIFHPRKPKDRDRKIWKEHESRYDAETGINHIRQRVFVQDQNGLTQFPYCVDLQYYRREELLAVLARCGYTVRGEFRNRARELWRPGDREWMVEADRGET